MSTTSAINSQDIPKEISNFVSGASYGKKVNSHELSRCAIALLKTLPAAREAVLEHLCNVFDEAVHQHTSRSDIESSASGLASSFDESIIQELHSTLSQFITSNPSAWSPLITSWALSLLGQLSSKYAGKRGMPHSGSLTELLQMWLSCRATRSLLDLSTQAISTLIGTDPDFCVDVLLDTSVQHSPNFDWVVAHIGSCFPKTIITRVLVCGLKDFCNYGTITSANQCLLHTEKKVPKLASVVGILGHLAAQHNEDIRKALLLLFNESFSSNPTQQQLATIPFLLQLASMSDMLLRVITTDFVTTLNADILNQLCDQIPLWHRSVVMDFDSLTGLVVHLVLGSEDGGNQVLHFLLNMSVASDGRLRPQAQKACGLILDSLLLEMQRLVFKPAACFSDVPLLNGLQQEISGFCSTVLTESNRKKRWLLPIITAIGMQGGERIGSLVLKHMLTNAESTDQLWNFVLILHSLEPSQSELANIATEQVISQLTAMDRSTLITVLNNLFCLIRWETRGKLVSRSNLMSICQSNFSKLSLHLCSKDPEISLKAAEILSLLPPAESINLFTWAQVCRAAVRHFFNTVKLDSDIWLKLNQIELSQEITLALAKQQAALYYWLRLLVEGLLSEVISNKFGRSVLSIKKRSYECAFMMSQQNFRHATTVTLPLSHSTVFHAGIVGKGPLKQTILEITPQAEVLTNCNFLIDTLQTACLTNGQSELMQTVPAFSAADTLSLILVELISPDVMFNGLPWPDEDFMKVTVERDLQIKRSFDEHPVLWIILEFLTSFPPSLCYCSVLIRALVAVSISFWNSCQEKVTSNCPKQLELTYRIVNVMSVGQLLPTPLCHVGELFPTLTPYELSFILGDIWRYMKENVPSPNIFIRSNNGAVRRKDSATDCNPKFTYNLRHILQKNIRRFGKLYRKLFSTERTLP